MTFGTAAVEWNIPMGGRNIYGLLGGNLKPGESLQLRVEVLATSLDGRPFVESLASTIDQQLDRVTLSLNI
jgi:hypothetical protein